MTTTLTALYTELFNGEGEEVRREAELLGHGRKTVCVVYKSDGTVDIEGYALGFKSLADPVFNRLVRAEVGRETTFINREGLIVEFDEVGDEDNPVLRIRKVPSYVRDKVTDPNDRPRSKARIQDIPQNLAPYIDAGFTANHYINPDDYAPGELETHHINGRESDDRPENLVTLPRFIHSKVHRRNVDRSRFLLYDEEARIGMRMLYMDESTRNRTLLNLNLFKRFCERVGVNMDKNEKARRAREALVTAFDKSESGRLAEMYDERLARQVTELQYAYQRRQVEKGKARREDIDYI